MKKGCQLVDTFFHDNDALKDKVRDRLEQDFPDYKDTWITRLRDVCAVCYRVPSQIWRAPWPRNRGYMNRLSDVDEEMGDLHARIMRQVGYPYSPDQQPQIPVLCGRFPHEGGHGLSGYSVLASASEYPINFFGGGCKRGAKI